MTDVNGNQDESLNLPKDADDTTMEGDFSPAEAEGMAEYNKLMAAMEKGEDYDPDATTEEAPPADEANDEPPKADPVEAAKEETPVEQQDPQQTEEDLSVIVTQVAETVASVEAELKAAEDKAIALGDQLENGEITQAKYDIEYRRAIREIESVEGKLASARVELGQSESAAEQAALRADPWYQAATSFLAESGNAIFNAGDHHEGLKQAIAFAAGLKQNADKSPSDIIRIAADTYRGMAGLAKPAAKAEPAKHAAKPAPGIPPTLGQMQAAVPNTDDSPFAHLQNLSGPAYEEAYLKLTPAQRDAFMDSIAG